MLLNENQAIVTSFIALVPYEEKHVPRYHAWMQDEELLELTASEKLTLEEELANQREWRSDALKLTFLTCEPPSDICQIDSTIEERLLGDVNVFFSPFEDEAPDGQTTWDGPLQGEISLMVARKEARGKKYGWYTLLTLLTYLAHHELDICTTVLGGMERGSKQAKRSISSFFVKIDSENVASIGLFERAGFKVIGGGPNAFNEIELRLEASWRDRSRDLGESLQYTEVPYPFEEP